MKPVNKDWKTYFFFQKPTFQENITRHTKSKTEKHVPKKQNKSSEINLKHMEIY